MGQTKHDKVASNLAKKEGTTYNKGPGPDIQTPRRAIEVETPKTIGDAGQQLRGFKKPVYVVPTNPKSVPDVIQRYKNTQIGVMTPSGKIVKPSSRGK